MPHQPGHDPAQEKALLCSLQAATNASSALAALEGLRAPWPAPPGHPCETVLGVLAKQYPREVMELGDQAAQFCYAGELVTTTVTGLVRALLADSTPRGPATGRPTGFGVP